MKYRGIRFFYFLHMALAMALNTLSHSTHEKPKNLWNIVNVVGELLVDAFEVTTQAIQQAAEKAVTGLKKGAEYLYTDVIIKNLIRYNKLIEKMKKEGMNLSIIEQKRQEIMKLLSENLYLKNFGYLIA